MEEQRTEGVLAVVWWCRRDLEAPWADTGPNAQLLAATHSGLAAEALVLNVKCCVSALHLLWDLGHILCSLGVQVSSTEKLGVILILFKKITDFVGVTLVNKIA